MKAISPFLWFDHQAEEAADFYTSLFPGSRKGQVVSYGESSAKAAGRKPGSVMTVAFELEGWQITAINGGPAFQLTPAFSFFVHRKTEKEVDELWRRLSEGGEVRMALGAYPWSEKYGWVKDRFGLDWQIALYPEQQNIVPAFLFVRNNFGKGEEALRFYTSLFPDSKIVRETKDEKTGTILHSTFTLNGQTFALMEGQGEHLFQFTPAFSLVVGCDSQEEIDRYWNSFVENGGTPSQCGWLQDKFGVSWQITPSRLPELLSEPGRAERVMKAVLSMQKLDLAALEKAARGA